MNLRTTIYKHPRLVRFIRFIYHDVYEGITKGYFWYMFCYFLRTKKSEIEQLEKMGFSNIEPYKSRTWRRGDELDHAHRRYYSATFSGQPCFIKVAENDKTIQNEIVVANRIKNEKWEFVPTTFLTESNFIEKRKMLAISFETGLHSIPDDISQEDLLRLCAEFLQIHKLLVGARLVHADIHRGNLMLDSNNHLKLLDFGISKFLDADNDVDYVARPGTFYQKTASGRIYDDAYSFLKMIEKLPAHSSIVESQEYKAISDKIGLAQFEVEINI